MSCSWRALCRGRYILGASNVARAGKRGNICVGNNVSSFARAFLLVSE